MSDKQGSLKNELFLKWLNSAHQSSLLVYSKKKGSKLLARKLRPEVAKLYIANTHSDALWLIERYNSNPDIPGIDAVIADADLNALKLIEAINKRANTVGKSQFPIIATLLLLPPNIDADYLHMLSAVGGANALLSFPGLSYSIFNRVLELMYQMKSIESAYTDLSKTTQMASHKFIPLFQSDLDLDGDGRPDAEQDDDHLEEDDVDSQMDNEGNQSVSSWTYASSILPDFVKDRRTEIAR